MLRDFLHLWLVGVSFTCVMFTGSLGKRTKLTKFHLDWNYQLDLRIVATTVTTPSNDVIWIHNWLDSCMCQQGSIWPWTTFLLTRRTRFPRFWPPAYCLNLFESGRVGLERVVGSNHQGPRIRRIVRHTSSGKDQVSQKLERCFQLSTPHWATYELTIHPFIPSNILPPQPDRIWVPWVSWFGSSMWICSQVRAAQWVETMMGAL